MTCVDLQLGVMAVAERRLGHRGADKAKKPECKGKWGGERGRDREMNVSGKVTIGGWILFSHLDMRMRG